MSAAAPGHGSQELNGLPDGTTVRVTAGGLSAEEAATLLLALHAARAEDRRTEEARMQPSESAWLRAGRRELLGGPPVASPTDLRGGVA